MNLLYYHLRIFLEYKKGQRIIIMLWFFVGFIFGVYVAQEAPETFPNVKQTGVRLRDFIYDIAITDKKNTNSNQTRTRSKSE